MANDWDFSDEGRSRQSNRMKTFADFEKAMEDLLYVILFAHQSLQEKTSMQI